MNGKMKVRRVRRKIELKWVDAEKIITFTDEPYRSLFRFQLWSGLGDDEVNEIQNSPDIQQSIEKQRANGYIKITLSPRKMNLDDYYTLIPSEYVPVFPVKTRTNAPVDEHDIQAVWRRRSAKKAGLYKVGLGAHTLRSSFRSQCGKADVATAVGEFFMGHGGGDKFGYSREALDEEYARKEIEKLWSYNNAGSREAYSDLEKKVKELAEWKMKHEALIKALEKEYKT